MGVARAYIDFENLLPAFMDNNLLNIETWGGIPKDAEILNGGYDEEKQAWFVDFQHASFEDFEPLDVEIVIGRKS